MTIIRRLDVNGDMTFGQGLANFAAASEACSQNIKTRLLLLGGEWFLDISSGVPYLNQIFPERADPQTIESVLKKTIVETTDVQSLNSFSMFVDHNIRKLTVSASVTTIYGDVTNIKVDV